jgi:predicted O-linked N-acetylglucosamine transferase (SPINDLY family)
MKDHLGKEMKQMRFIELTKLVLEYNELLKKIEDANAWLKVSKATEKVKEEFREGKYQEAWKRLGDISEILDKHGITYKDYESIEGIELPEVLKRDKVEIFLEEYAKFLKEKEKLKVGT